MEEENEVIDAVSTQGVDPQKELNKLFSNNKPNTLDSAAASKAYNLPGFGDSQYDKNIKIDSQLQLNALFASSLEQNRAGHQPKLAEFGNAVGRLTNIIPEAIGGMAAALDFEDYFNSNDEVGNWLTDFTNDWKEATNEALPIYRQNPGKALDFGDSAWWMSNGSSLVQSIGGFAITGGVIGKGLQGLSKLAKLKKITTLITNANTANKIGEGAQTLGTAMALNQAEAILEAGEVYETIYAEHVNKLSQTTNKSQEEIESLARQKAADAASVTVNTNRINILLNISSANLFVKSPRITRKSVKKPSTLNNIKRGGIEGVQESAEELINFISSKRGLADGRDQEYTLKDIYNDIQTPEAKEAALLGFLGGLGQTIITTEGVNRINKTVDPETGEKMSVRAYNKRVYNKYKNELETISNLKNVDDVKQFTDVYESFEYQQLINSQLEKAIENDDQATIENLQNLSLDGQALNSFKAGTTEALIQLYEDLGAGEQKAGMDENYKERSNKAVERIKNLEKIYNKVANEVNFGQLYNNRAMVYNLEDQIDRITFEKNKVQSELQTKVDRLVESTKDPELKKAHEKNLLKYSPLNKELDEYNAILEEKSQFIDYLNEDYKTINSKKHKAQYKKDLEKANENIEQDLDELSDEVEATAAEEAKEAASQAADEAITNDIKDADNDKKDTDNAKRESNVAYKSLFELINNPSDYDLENVPNSPGVFTKGESNTHLPIIQSLPGFENLKGDEAIMLTPTSKGIQVLIQDSETGETIEFEVNQYNLPSDNTVVSTTDEDVNNNDYQLDSTDNTEESEKFQKQEGDDKVNKAVDASLVNAYDSDYTSDNYQEYAETPRDKVGEEVTFELGVNISLNNFKINTSNNTAFYKSKRYEISIAENANRSGKLSVSISQSNGQGGYVYSDSKSKTDEFENIEDAISYANKFLKNDSKINSIQAQDAIELYKQIVNGKKDLTDSELELLIRSLPIKVNIDENTFTHLPFESETSSVILTDAEYNIRKNIIAKIISNKSFDGIKSQINFQYPGIVKQDIVEGKPASNSILELPNINNDISKVEFYISDSNGNILDLNNQPNTDFGKSSFPGNIFIKVRTANGKAFPLKLNIRRVNQPEANVVYKLTEALLNPSKELDFKSTIDSVKELLELETQELESLKQEASILGKNLKSATIIDIMSSIVFEGNSKKNYYKINGTNLIYGDNVVNFSELKENKGNIIDWLTKNKNRNVKKSKLSLKSYKEFYSNNVLSTDAKLGEPTFGGNTKIYLDTNIVGNKPPSAPKNDFANLLAVAKKEMAEEEGGAKATPDKVINSIPDKKVRKNIKNKLKKGSRAALKAKAKAKKQSSSMDNIPSTKDTNKKCD